MFDSKFFFLTTKIYKGTLYNEKQVGTRGSYAKYKALHVTDAYRNVFIYEVVTCSFTYKPYITGQQLDFSNAEVFTTIRVCVTTRALGERVKIAPNYGLRSIRIMC